MNKKKSEKSNNAEIREELKDKIADIANLRDKEVNDDTLIRDELGIDSIMAMEILANIEKFYNIDIEEQKALQLNTVGKFLNYIESKVTAKRR